MNKEMHEIHEEVFQFLMDYHKKDENFLFTLRQINRGDKLDKGYWFLGNDDYLAVSFWGGKDWKNKTHNLYFRIEKDGRCFFVLSTKDNENKAVFVREYILPLLNTKLKEFIKGDIPKSFNDLAVLDLGEGDFLDTLKMFIQEIKPEIDSAINQFDDDYDAKFNENYRIEFNLEFEIKELNDSDRIGFLHTGDFNKQVKKIKEYQQKYNNMNCLPYSLEQFSASSFQGIKETGLSDLPADAHWIFLTGKNGYGKTSLLKAITIGLYGKEDAEDDGRNLAGKQTKVELHINELNNNGLNLESRWLAKNGRFSKNKIPVVAYGPIRIPSGNSSVNQKSNVKSLFSTDGDILYNFENDLKDLYKNEEIIFANSKAKIINNFSLAVIKSSEKDKSIFEEYSKKDDSLIGLAYFEQFDAVLDKIKGVAPKKAYNDLVSIKKEIITNISKLKYSVISNFLLEVMDNIKDIQIKEDGVVYFEVQEPNIAKSNDQLASGNRMLLSWIGDMLMRLNYKAYDTPKDVKGIVIIDEFDLHLHPIWQKRLPGILSENLPNVQFIASTHSCIPLLGAPEGSVFLKVDRSEEKGIEVERLKKLEKEIKYLLPNTILTSDIFDFELFESMSEEDFNAVRLENDYTKIEENKEIDERLKKINKDIFPDDLFDNE